MYRSGKKVLVVGGDLSYYKPYSSLFESDIDHKNLYKNPHHYGLILFTGGADVNPDLYGDISSDNISVVNKLRDEKEQEIFKFAKDKKIPMAGICRGLQFLNVMAGGRLLHDITGHTGLNGFHMMDTYKGLYRVNSLHHQACIPGPKSYVIGWAVHNPDLKVYGNYDRHLKYWPTHIVEAMIFPEINSYGVQYHPEMMNNTELGVQWFIELATDFATFNTVDGIINKWTHRRLFYTREKKYSKSVGNI